MPAAGRLECVTYTLPGRSQDQFDLLRRSEVFLRIDEVTFDYGSNPQDARCLSGGFSIANLHVPAGYEVPFTPHPASASSSVLTHGNALRIREQRCYDSATCA
jgi:hypothetical protein